MPLVTPVSCLIEFRITVSGTTAACVWQHLWFTVANTFSENSSFVLLIDWICDECRPHGGSIWCFTNTILWLCLVQDHFCFSVLLFTPGRRHFLFFSIFLLFVCVISSSKWTVESGVFLLCWIQMTLTAARLSCFPTAFACLFFF